MSRWEVKRVRLRTGGWGEWAACNHDTPTRYFLTHAEALAYADQRARTVEVKLPPEEYVWESGLDSDGRHYVTDRWDHTICYYPNGDENGEGTLKEIALHFLAYAYKTTNKEN